MRNISFGEFTVYSPTKFEKCLNSVENGLQVDSDLDFFHSKAQWLENLNRNCWIFSFYVSNREGGGGKKESTENAYEEESNKGRKREMGSGEEECFAAAEIENHIEQNMVCPVYNKTCK